MKLSQWHNGKVKPVHIGVYEIKYENCGSRTIFSFFDGKFWRGWTSPFDFKAGYYPHIGSFIIAGQTRKWRGIVKDKK